MTFSRFKERNFLAKAFSVPVNSIEIDERTFSHPSAYCKGRWLGYLDDFFYDCMAAGDVQRFVSEDDD